MHPHHGICCSPKVVVVDPRGTVVHTHERVAHDVLEERSRVELQNLNELAFLNSVRGEDTGRGTMEGNKTELEVRLTCRSVSRMLFDSGSLSNTNLYPLADSNRWNRYVEVLYPVKCSSLHASQWALRVVHSSYRPDSFLTMFLRLSRTPYTSLASSSNGSAAYGTGGPCCGCGLSGLCCCCCCSV